MIQKNYKRLSLTIAIATLLLFAAAWAYGHAFMTIRMGETGIYSYTLKDPSGETQTGTSDKQILRKFVKRGTYQISITQGSKGYTAIVRVKAFLRNTDVVIKVSPQQQRTFIGKNPAPCMYIIADKLISTGCGGTLDYASIHMPGNDTTPPYVDQFDAVKFLGSTIDIIQTKTGTYSFSKTIDTEETKAAYYIQSIQNDLTPGSSVKLTALAAGDTFRATPYRNGFIVYNQTGKDAWYYDLPTSQPQRITINDNENSLSLVSVRTNGDIITATYSNVVSNAEDETETLQDVRGTSAVYIYDNKKTQHSSFETALNDAQLCATNTLCVLNGKRFQAYDIQSRPKLLYTLANVSAMYANGTDVFLQQENSLLKWNPVEKSGHMAYQNPDYRLCGINTTANGILICAINKNDDKVALLIDPSKPDLDQIDQKIRTLQKTLENTDVTIDRTRIYITPDTSSIPLAYNAKLKIYEPDPEQLNSLHKDILAAVTKAQIDTKKYIVIDLSQY